MKKISPETRKEIFKKFLNKEYQQQATIEKIMKMFNIKFTLNHKNEFFMEKAVIEKLKREYKVSDKILDDIIEKGEQ